MMLSHIRGHELRAYGHGRGFRENRAVRGERARIRSCMGSFGPAVMAVIKVAEAEGHVGVGAESEVAPRSRAASTMARQLLSLPARAE